MLHHLDTGTADKPVVLLGGALGSTHRMWDEQVTALAGQLRLIAFDHRGHGDSPAAEPGVTVADLADDVAELADDLGLARFGYVGISLGGAVGQELARRGRVSTLILAATAARFGEPGDWQARADLVRERGMAPIVATNAPRWLSEAVSSERAEQILGELAAQDRHSYAALCGAVGAFDSRSWAGSLPGTPLVVGGAQDPAVPATRALAALLPRHDYVELDQAGHLVNVCQPAAFNDLLVRAFG
ncbi:MAG: alpha/beta fold hydrolase [Propioniciclava sp.]